MLYSYTCSESQLFMVNVESYSQRCSNTHTSVKTCNQTGQTAIRHWQNINTATLSVALPNPRAPHTHTHKGSGPVHRNWSFYQREPRQQKKGENDCMLFTKHALRYTCSKECQSEMNISIGCVDQRQCREQNGTCKSST